MNRKTIQKLRELSDEIQELVHLTGKRQWYVDLDQFADDLSDACDDAETQLNLIERKTPTV